MDETRIVGALVAAVGALITALGVVALWRGWRSLRWPATTGVVISRAVEESSGSLHPSHSPSVRYRYEVRGVARTGRRVHWGQGLEVWHTSEDWAKRVTSRYVPMSQVAVYHHPHSPRLAVLEPGVRWRLLYTVAFGLLLYLLGLLVDF